jgi:pilus assembly protein CpaF
METYENLGEFIYAGKGNKKETVTTYESILEKTREHIGTNHSEQLSAVITDPNAGAVVRRLIAEYIKSEELKLDGKNLAQLADMLYGDMVGFGFLDTYIHDEEIEEINGNSWRDIEVVKMDEHFKLPEHFRDPQRAVDTIKKMARLGNLILDNQTPIIDSYLTKGIRLSAAIPPIVDSETGVAFSLRRQRMAKTTAQDLLGWKTASKDELEFMTMAVNHGISLGFSGATSSGKTTDISFVLNNVDVNKRIYTIEENRELDLVREDKEGNVISRVVHLCTRESSTEKMTVDANQLLRHALRFHPDVICVAEMRGAEAMTAQEAARTGHAVVTSLHANSARASYFRILSLCRMSGTELEDATLMKFIVEAFPIMVYKKQLANGERRIMEIIEAIGLKDGEVDATTLFKYNMETQNHEHVGGISDALAQRLLDDGVDEKTVEKYSNVKKKERRMVG